MEKEVCFITEYRYINDVNVLLSLKYMISALPDYFFQIPASSTGKYHPSYALGEGGLLRHTKAAVRIAHELLINDSVGNTFTSHEKDLIIMALILHDGLKSGLEKTEYTQVNHPLLISDFIKKNAGNLKIKDDDIKLLCRMVEAHMGPFNKDFKGNAILPIPEDKYQRFVHMCDYLASKKFININFQGNEIVE